MRTRRAAMNRIPPMALRAGEGGFLDGLILSGSVERNGISN